MPAHHSYPFNDFGLCHTLYERSDDLFRISIDTTRNPFEIQYADTYFYELLLITWENDNDKEVHPLQRTEWISRTGPQQGFDFGFTLNNNSKHWLLCFRQSLGINQKEIGVMATNRLELKDAGSFDVNDLLILPKRKENVSKRK